MWDDAGLATWGTPVAGLNVRPGYFSSAEYYRAPIDNLRTYPVYLPDREPAGYWEVLRKKHPEPLIELNKTRTKAEWIVAGKRVWEELDVPIFRLFDSESIALARSSDHFRDSKPYVQPDGSIFGYRWVVTSRGIALTLSECSSCHVHHMDDGTAIAGPGFNRPIGDSLGSRMADVGNQLEFPGDSYQRATYRQYAVPWIKDDIHKAFTSMSRQEAEAIFAAQIAGVIDRTNGSPFYIAKVPDLIGFADRAYIDHTATHRHRGPADLMKYAALVSFSDSMDFGPHRILSDAQRKVLYRSPDEALYALAEYIYSLKPPPNPNPFNDLAARGKEIFAKTGCSGCHTPPLYTNNKVTLAEGFTPPPAHPNEADILPMSVGTDPNLALKTRKGTGLYKIPSLKGVWYRGLYGHDGAIASLEDWFDPVRLRDDYVPSGFKGYGVKTRAVKGHEFGLNLSADDRRALIAFLKTL
jgi:hypothetical protein